MNKDFSVSIGKTQFFFLSSKVSIQKIDLIGILEILFHNPKDGKSIQLGNAEFISKEFNKPVI